jgi:hypothetical protein
LQDPVFPPPQFSTIDPVELLHRRDNLPIGQLVRGLDADNTLNFVAVWLIVITRGSIASRSRTRDRRAASSTA